MLTVDINCDMGEGCDNDVELMDYVSSVNIACGAHAGDVETMRKTVAAAIQKGVYIGAHPGYPDRAGFGRNAMAFSLDEIFEIVRDQIVVLRDICVESGARLSHVKPHGALYNQSAKDSGLASTIARAVRSIDPELILYGLSGSLSITEGKRCGIRTASEAFADRTYRPDGSLTPRSESTALIYDADVAVAQVMAMIKTSLVVSTDGQMIPIYADTACIHGDGENALEFAREISLGLARNGISLRPIGAA